MINPPPIDRMLAAVSYGYPWSTLLVQYKFQDKTGWAKSFATLLRSTPWVEPALDAADMLIPMPLSKERLAERGFNQCALLAKALDSAKTQVHLLQRVLDTPAQRTLARQVRLSSVQHAFAVDPLQSYRLKGQRVVLLDDVMTTGASLHAAAKALRQAGASHITGLVFARTE
ncbi:ComF family protein [Rhodoferax aquaticus]|uniref:ComF family protein n=1 Tax=Rhodoferax aquaticus TaxID=2527691 RepID=UPI00315A9715